MSPPFENTGKHWSRLEAWAESGAESLTSDKMLVVPLFGNLSVAYIIVGINIVFGHSL